MNKTILGQSGKLSISVSRHFGTRRRSFFAVRELEAGARDAAPRVTGRSRSVAVGQWVRRSWPGEHVAALDIVRPTDRTKRIEFEKKRTRTSRRSDRRRGSGAARERKPRGNRCGGPDADGARHRQDALRTIANSCCNCSPSSSLRGQGEFRWKI